MSHFWRAFCFMSSKTENVCVKALKSCLLSESTSHQGSWHWNIKWGAFCKAVVIYTLQRAQAEWAFLVNTLHKRRVTIHFCQPKSKLLPAEFRMLPLNHSKQGYSSQQAWSSWSFSEMLHLLPFLAYSTVSDIKLATGCNTGDSRECWSISTAVLWIMSASM